LYYIYITFLANKGDFMKSTGSLYSADRVYIQQEAIASPEKTTPLGQAVIAKQSDHTPIALPPEAHQKNHTLLTLSTPQSPTGTPQAFLEKKAAEVSQPKQAIPKMKEFEDSDSEDSDLEEDLVIEKHTRLFLSHYLINKEEGMNYLSQHKYYIDLNYNNGAIMYLAADKKDIEMIKFLFGKVADKGLLRGLGISAYNGDTECTELFMDFLDQHGIDYSSKKKTTAYTNHPHIKALFDKRIVNAKLLIKSAAENNSSCV
jgi:hypothetical protein